MRRSLACLADDASSVHPAGSLVSLPACSLQCVHATWLMQEFFRVGKAIKDSNDNGNCTSREERKEEKKFLFARSLDNFSPDNLPLVPQEHNPKDYQFISLSTTHHSHPLDKLSQLCKLDRLGQVMIDSTAHRLFLCLRRCQAGEGDYLGRFEALFLLVAADFARCREAVHDGHGNIHQHVVE